MSLAALSEPSVRPLTDLLEEYYPRIRMHRRGGGVVPTPIKGRSGEVEFWVRKFKAREGVKAHMAQAAVEHCGEIASKHGIRIPETLCVERRKRTILLTRHVPNFVPFPDWLDPQLAQEKRQIDAFTEEYKNHSSFDIPVIGDITYRYSNYGLQHETVSGDIPSRSKVVLIDVGRIRPPLPVNY